MRILLVQDKDEEIRDRVVFALESTFGAIILSATDLKEALKFLQNPQERFDFAIWDCQSATSSEHDKFVAQATTLPIIDCKNLIPGVPLLESKAKNIFATVDRATLIQSLLSVIAAGIEKKILSDSFQLSDFCKIKTKLLLSVCPLKGDIYIRLSDNHYVKLFNQGDKFELDDMQKYTEKKGIEYLFIRKDQTQEFLEKYSADLRELVAQAQPLSLDAAQKLNDSLFDTVQEMGRRIGFTKDVQNIAKNQVQCAMKVMGKSPRLKDFLGKMETFKGQYISTHSSLTGYLACAIAAHHEWGSDATFHKLTLAAFLHDIALDNHELAKCKTLDDAKKAGFDKAQLEAYKAHPVKAADIARQFTEVPPDVDAIIVQHHELPDGSGFPRGLGHSYISPLSALFSVAHEMADYSLAAGPNFNVRQFLADVSQKYSSSRFRSVLAAIEEAFQGK